MSDPLPYTNAQLRMMVRKCREDDCMKQSVGKSKWCEFHRKERPVLRRRFRGLNLDKFKASALVKQLEANSEAQEER